jgi:hypothetical protein
MTTALELINRAFNLSQVVSRELQTVSGSQQADGLYLLNALLDFKGSDLHLIPYFNSIDFNLVVNQEEYFIENLLYVDSLTFTNQNVRYSMYDMSRKDYFGSPRVNDIQSLPFQYRPEREKGGMRLYLYFLPDQAYAAQVWGKFGLTQVTLTTDMSSVYDPFYIEYLRYGLAEMICSEYGITFPMQSKQTLQEYEKKLLMTSPPDLSVQKMSYFGGNPSFDWQAVNLWRGYWPTS